jgi:hypothetical protein
VSAYAFVVTTSFQGLITTNARRLRS